jgi:hypothetical protein
MISEPVFRKHSGIAIMNRETICMAKSSANSGGYVTSIGW